LTSLIGGLGGSSSDAGSSSSGEVILAGHVTFVPSITYTNGGVAGGNFPLDLSKPFLTIPSGMTATAAGGITAPITEDSTAVFNRLDIGSGTSEWSVYYPAGLAGATLTLPAVPTGFTSPAVAGAKVTINSVSLQYPPAGATTPETYDGIWAFDGIDADDLTHETDNFSSRGMPTF
jgi:hypothetical protein